MFKDLIILLSGFLASFLIMPSFLRWMRRIGVCGVDVHKPDRPKVPEMGGLVVLIGLAVSVSSALMLWPERIHIFLSFFATALIAGVIGIIDDLKTLNAKIKPLLTLLSGVPILVFGTYAPHPIFPLVGQTRLYVVYPFLIPIAIAVTSNAVNMMDPFNGTMSGTCTIATIFLLVSAIMLGRSDSIILCLCLLGPLLVLYYYNRYPSKVFSGDVGSLCIGASLGAIAIIGQMEVIAVVAFFPQIMNAFYGLSSIGRLYERREVARPVMVLEDGRLMATMDPKAPITLARLILSRGPLREDEATLIFFVLSTFAGFLSLLTAYLILVKI
ncbi:MAG: hypothetical protein NZ952_00420 [Candidatus Bathyarchaeota archaeon]|nr:hypothetical protein [Candidatus Bathyarchaeota archaeon]